MPYDFEPYEGWEEDLHVITGLARVYGTTPPDVLVRLSAALKATHEHDWRIDPHSCSASTWGNLGVIRRVICGIAGCGESRAIPPLASAPKSEWPKYFGTVLEA